MDKKIIDDAIAGDSAAFEQIYKATFVRAHTIAIGIVKDDFEAYDIVQEAYITLLQKLHTLEDPKALESWFSRIVHNTAIDFVRKNRPALFSDLESGDEESPALVDTISSEYGSFDPEQVADRAEIREILEKIINTLPKKQRICILLRWQKDMKISEIAKATRLSESTVKSCLRYGHEKIAQKVQELEKKGYKLRSLTPIVLIPCLRWALGGKGLVTSAQAAAAGATAGGIAASASVAASASSSAVTAGVVSSVAMKVAAGITAAALVIGGGVYAGTQLFAPEELPEDPPVLNQGTDHSSDEKETDTPSQDQQEDPAPDPLPTAVYATFFGNTAVLTSEPIAQFEDNAADSPSGLLTGGFLEDYPDRFWDITRVVIPDNLVPESTQGWFDTMGNLQTIEGLENIDTSLVTDMDRMFLNCESLTTITGIANWNVSNVKTMASMFSGCKKLTAIDDLSKWDTASLQDMDYMFLFCENLPEVTGLGSWKLGDTCRAQSMFEDCVKLVSVGDLNSWGSNQKLWKGRMFANTGLQELPMWYIEYEFFNTGRDQESLPRDAQCCTSEAIARIRQRYPDMDLSPYLDLPQI